MANIDIHHPHDHSMKEARAAVERVAQKMHEKFGIRHEWNGNELDFHGSGAKGRITLGKKEVHLSLSLGFPVSMFRSSIEAEVHKYLERELG
ncbi:MAG TPA: polyhydroxyalkanoic acid system family protein [Xanthomonadaceae bacterium]|jgi:putative polyhydroxyalkanoate system protein|nr:polyhydroxyalkanoic acid system family protein [Xanthomonadaceae bacterium]